MKKSMFSAEWKAIFTKPKFLISMIAILFIPIMYSGVYLWAFWDPYSHLDRLPVAVVNEDKGAAFEGDDLQLGKDLVDNLKDNDKFEFHFVNKENGYQGLEREKYYMLVEIPSDFSEHATTLLEDHPEKLQLKYVPNQGYNFISSQIGESAMKDIKASLSKEVTKTYAEKIFEKIQELGDGFSKASDGSEKLANGAIKLSDGASQLKNNLEKLASKSIEFENGVSKLKAGTDEVAKGSTDLSSGLGKLVDGHQQLVQGAKASQAGADKLANGASQTEAGVKKADDSMGKIIDGTGQLTDGAASLSDNLKKFQTGADAAANGAQDLNDGINSLQQQLEPMLPSLPEPQKTQLQEAMKKLSDGSQSLADGTKNLDGSAGQLSEGASTISSKLNSLNAGQKQLKNGLDQLAQGSSQLANGANSLSAGQDKLIGGMETFDQKLREAKSGSDQLAQGANQLAGGMNDLSSGSNKMTDGTQKLADGSADLSSGTDDLKKGSEELHDKLADGAEKANSVHSDDQTYDMMGEPVKVKKDGINKVPNYGTGFAPYFISLSLFVGALMLSIIFPMREPAGNPKNGFSWFIGKFGVIGIVGILQSVIVDIVLLNWLNLKVESVPFFFLTTIATSLTFIAIIQFLVTVLDNPGRFLGVIILILQLTTSAGTYPLETIPKMLQPIHYLLPMSYTVQAFKAVISSGDYDFMWTNIYMLGVYFIGFLLLTMIYFVIKFIRVQRKNPSQEAAA
ncbi:YhgE/Pip domain-containing protein [Falsibacillus albus]|uniref:YhgE/Pip domain-containing protein n=1 Tax=Falsibacillus albus TaxID=2478915 RepID=A0A3L7K2J0_9BACI|nr:YhgE/Pip domain-containing protein [Falsibacillus albus]RLQ97276.1 YhgE/Pip domain-containing protein [Falsibacillus albus]